MGANCQHFKDKGMVVGSHLTPTDTMPVQLEEGQIEVVQEFPYLGSTITRDGEIKGEVMCRISKAARSFGCLQKSIFQNRHLSVETKRKVYRAVVLSVLLYGAETWTIKAESVRRLSSFHNRCIRTILGVSRYQQWKEHISSKRLAEAFGMEELMLHLLMRQRLRWLSHLDRMEPSRMPKQLLFGELEKKRPSHGTKKRWRDVAAADIKAVGVSDGWYDLAQNREAWKALCEDGHSLLVEHHQAGWRPGTTSFGHELSYPCKCGRSFRRKGDLTRHHRFCRSAVSSDL